MSKTLTLRRQVREARLKLGGHPRGGRVVNSYNPSLGWLTLRRQWTCHSHRSLACEGSVVDSDLARWCQNRSLGANHQAICATGQRDVQVLGIHGGGVEHHDNVGLEPL